MHVPLIKYDFALNIFHEQVYFIQKIVLPKYVFESLIRL